MSKYPRDEFDNVPESSSRQGVHRTAMDAPRPGLWPIVAFAVVALLIGAAAFLVIPRLIGTAPAASGESSSGQSPSNSATADSPSPSSSAASTPPATPTAPSTPTTPPPPPVDKTQPVNVYNATTISGLSARVAQQVRADGWTVPLSANWQGYAQPSSVIFYNGAAQKPNADALGALLGITRLVDTADLGIPLAVVLGPGAQ
ncbi:LytR C-terminal domain-containing protein [Arthrobacter russicus]|uniref:Cytoskeletal protein RodZ n=1 Tax=Arthrobacter russicus TaxID=172040 RepID=A0ABU1JA20_9MICC|nr:LytR C-terminal domain-containing protein [Arthrobacter russicus]MDN5669805.1 LytR C-terminal domain-containing protein [Renibacterium salmoninarum]MDR6269270.1 cytoskeletal protein RodZ [Arthrobacter russicus]